MSPRMLILIWFNPSEAYLEDPRPFFNQVNGQKARGVTGLYEGPQLRCREETLAWVISYKTAEHQLRFMQLEDYAHYVIPLMDAFTGRLDSLNVLLPREQPYARALAAPVTEFVYLTLRERQSAADALPRLAAVDAALARARGYQGAAFGPASECEETLVWIAGWASVEAQAEAIRNKAVAAAWAHVRECATLERKYAELRLTDSTSC